MKRSRFTGALLLTFCLVVFGRPGQAQGPVDFTGHQVVQLETRSQGELDWLLNLGVDVWTENVGVGPLEVRVSPEQLAQIRARGLGYTVLIPDVQAEINRERLEITPGDLFDNYLNLDQVNAYLDSQATAYPDVVQEFTAGYSVEGRPINGLYLNFTGSPSPPAVLFEGCQHAREWVAVMVPLYIADQLIANYGSDPYITDLLSTAGVYIVPVVNPDGYDYTWRSNRLWRKNRQGGYGVDLNRNWDSHWGGQGSSSQRSSDIYRGPSPLSEPETRAMANFMTGHPDILGSMDYHSFAQLLMYPWGWTSAASPDDATFAAVGSSMRNAIVATNRANYGVGRIYTTIYPASGTVVDWAYEKAGLWAFTIELRPNSGGNNGFLLPASQIRPTCTENFAGALVLIDWIRSLGG